MTMPMRGIMRRMQRPSEHIYICVCCLYIYIYIYIYIYMLSISILSSRIYALSDPVASDESTKPVMLA